MPRTKGSKNKTKLTLDEQITAAEERVSQLKEELAAAEVELQNLTALRDEEQIKELVAAIAERGISVADAIALINAPAQE